MPSSFYTSLLSLNPVCYLRLGEFSGVSASDSSGNGNTGVYEGAAGTNYSLRQAGLIAGDNNAGISVDGTAGYVLVNDSPSLHSADFSVGVLVVSMAAGGTQIISGQDNNTSGQRSWNMGLNVSGYPYFEVFSSDSSFTDTSGTVALANDGNSHYLFATYHYVANGTSEINLFVDGSLAASSSTAVGPRQTNYSNLTLGCRLYTGARGFFSGYLDEFAFFPSAITSANVAMIAGISQSYGGSDTPGTTLLLGRTPPFAPNTPGGIRTGAFGLGVPPPTGTTLLALGDSYTNPGVGAYPQANRYITLFCQAAGLTLNLQAISGSQVPDQTQVIAGLSISTSTVASILLGINDTRGVGTKTISLAGVVLSSGSPAVTVASTNGLTIGQVIVGENVPLGTTIAALSSPTAFTLSANATGPASGTYTASGTALDNWSAGYAYLIASVLVPSASRVPYNDGSITYVGTWSNATGLGGVKVTDTAGSTFTISFSGTKIYVAVAQIVNGGGFTVTIDSVSVSPINCTLQQATQNGATFGGAIYRFAGLSSGSHTLVGTYSGQGNAASAGAAYVNWYYAFTPPQSLGPKLMVYAVPFIQTSAYTGTQSSDYVTRQYNALLLKQCLSFAADGGLVQFIPSRLRPDEDFDNANNDPLHPNNAGHAILATDGLKALYGYDRWEINDVLGDVEGVVVGQGTPAPVNNSVDSPNEVASQTRVAIALPAYAPGNTSGGLLANNQPAQLAAMVVAGETSFNNVGQTALLPASLSGSQATELAAAAVQTAPVIPSGTAQGGGATTITLATSAPAIANLLNGQLIVLAGGTGAGQVAVIASYSASRVATCAFYPPATQWTVLPDNTTEYSLPGISPSLNSIGITLPS